MSSRVDYAMPRQELGDLNMKMSNRQYTSAIKALLPP